MKYPFVKQQGIEDCAVASIQMLLKYYKVNSNYQKLLNQTKVTKEGTTAYHITKTLHEYGFDAKGMRLELKELEELIKSPFIAHTSSNNLNHFIVVYKINKDKKTLTIADPNEKIKTITYEEFEQIWTKVIITVIQVIKKKKIKKTNSIFLLIKQTNINIKKLIATSLIIAILSIINSYYFMHMMNKGNLTTVFIAFVLIKILFEVIRNNQLIKIKQEIDEKITNESFKRIIELPYKYYENKTSGELVSKINDLELVKTSVIKIIFIIFLDLPLTIISLFFLLSI